jgi:hypothetical protein
MTLRTRRRVFLFVFLSGVVAATSAACLQDFGTFEAASANVADAAEAARPDAPPVTFDDGATDIDAGPDSAGPCVQAPLACLTPRSTCRTGCQADLGTCLVCQDGGADAGAGDGGSCEQRCRDAYNGCNGACNLTCLDCVGAGGCSAGCLSNE